MDLETDMTKVPAHTLEILASCHALVFVENKLVIMSYLYDLSLQTLQFQFGFIFLTGIYFLNEFNSTLEVVLYSSILICCFNSLFILFLMEVYVINMEA